MPAYIGSLVGGDAATSLFYAKDHKGTATVSSKDGVEWMVVDSTTAASLTVTAKDVAGHPAASLTDVTDGSYTGK